MPNWAASLLTPSVLFTVGTGLVLLGTYFQWRLSHVLMQAEEHMKEGRLSEDQARRRVRLANCSGPAMILLGAAVFAAVLML